MSKRKYRYLAIDWSGAKKPSDAARGIAVAALEPGDTKVHLLGPPDRWQWTREGVLELLKERATEGTPTVAGIDCNFALPFSDGEYMDRITAKTAKELWREIDEECADDKDFYAGSFVKAHKKGFWTKGKKPAKFELRLRATEKLTKEVGLGNPESPLKLDRPKCVGRAGLSGMRILNQLKCDKDVKNHVAVWPFDRPSKAARLTVVEIFPTLYRRISGAGNNKVKSRADLDSALRRLDSKFIQRVTHSLTDDETDALISVAGMAKTLEDCTEIMKACNMSKRARNAEGWIFGVPWTGMEQKKK